jgi:hypothetical protein
MSTAHESTTNPLADLIESDHEAVTALVGTSRSGGEWDNRPGWDNWKKTPGPWDNRPSWDNWKKR